MANDGELHAWILNGKEFAPLKGYPKDMFLMPTLSPSAEGWIMGGGSLEANYRTISPDGKMASGTLTGTHVRIMLHTPQFGMLLGGSSGLAPSLVRMK